MEERNPKVFVSYSWDNREHQQWVVDLTNRLRREGIDATMDLFETQQKTVNLNKMMIENIKQSDYVVIVLTEEYAKRADNFEGGVGFETLLTIPDIKSNLSKLIFIMRHNGDYTKVFPFHIRDIYAIDFSNDSQFESKLEELIYKIYNVPLYEVEPIGKMPDLKPRKNLIQNHETKNDEIEDIDDLLIPDLRQITDIDKNEFIKKSYSHIIYVLGRLLDKSKSVNSNFTYELEEITKRKVIIKIYVNGTIRQGMKIWYGSYMGMGENSIYISYGTWIDENNDTSMNQIINCVVNDKKELKLNMMMSFNGNKEMDADEVAKIIWMENIKNYLSDSIN